MMVETNFSNKSIAAPTNLPVTQTDVTVQFFDGYSQRALSFNPVDYDMLAAIFRGQGLSVNVVQNITMSILNQAKLMNIDIKNLIKTLQNKNGTTLSQVLAELLNSTRLNTSLVGFRTGITTNPMVSRTIRF